MIGLSARTNPMNESSIPDNRWLTVQEGSQESWSDFCFLLLSFLVYLGLLRRDKGGGLFPQVYSQLGGS